MASLGAGALVAIAIAAAPVRAGEEPARSTAAMAASDRLPDAQLIDQNGDPVSLASLKGKIILLGFIHTSCKGVCEMLTAKMHQVAQELGDARAGQVTMVSITTDPDEDRPAQLLAYARKQGVATQGWLFLTGPTDQIDRVLTVYGVPHENESDELTHVFSLYLIGRDGQLVRKYDSMATTPQVLAAAIRKTASP